MIEALSDAFAAVHQTLFQAMVEPAMFTLGVNHWSELAFDGVEIALLGVVQVALAWMLFRPLEVLHPAERWADRREVRADVIYTLVHRLGLVPLAIFVMFTPAQDWLDAALTNEGVSPFALDRVVPALADWPLVTFLLYVVILDFGEYWRHRFQHRLEWWWALHSLHHSQRQMTFWSEDRNHLLDTLLEHLWSAVIALAIGIPPAQFIAASILLMLSQNLQHANLRVGFGRIGERLLVSPRFHRTHHAVDLPQQGRAQSCNFAAILPLWDVLFGTADFRREYLPTGIPEDRDNGDYGPGFWQQQAHGLRLLAAALAPRRVWRLASRG